MAQEDLRRMFIESTMQVVGNQGLENTTTRKIADAAELSESHIFRCFDGKDDLLRQTFQEADSRLSAVVMRWLPVIRDDSLEHEDRCNLVLWRWWRFLLENPDLCRFYTRYYHSVSYDKYVEEGIGRRGKTLVENLDTFFPRGSHIDFLLDYILDIVFGFATRVLNGALPDSEEVFDQVFRLIYDAIGRRLREAGEDEG